MLLCRVLSVNGIQLHKHYSLHVIKPYLLEQLFEGIKDYYSLVLINKLLKLIKLIKDLNFAFF
jgi:hypothetical protein